MNKSNLFNATSAHQNLEAAQAYIHTRNLFTKNLNVISATFANQNLERGQISKSTFNVFMRI
jgi:hypothetical protein